MPIQATYVDASLVDATAHVPAAAKAEGLTDAQVAALWSGLGQAARNGLVHHAASTASNGMTLREWRFCFPAVFAEHSDEEASAILRVAVALAGGAVG